MIRTYARHLGEFSVPARVYLTALFLQFTGQTIVWVLRNLYLTKAGFDEEFIGYTLSASSLGATVSIVALAAALDRRRLKGFMVAASLMMSAGLLGVALWPQKVPVLAFSFVTGTGLGLSQMLMPIFFVRHSRGRERPYLFGVGQALMPLAGLWMTLGMKGGELLWGDTFEGARNMMLLGGVMPLLSLAMIARIREADPPPAPERLQSGGLDWRLGMKFWSTELVVGLGAGLTIPILNLYFDRRFGASLGDVGLFFAASHVIMFFGFLSTPVFASRWGAVRTILVFQFGSIPFFFAMAFATSLPLAVVAFLARQAMMNMVHPVSDHFLMEAADPGQRARLNGIKQMCRRASWIVATAAGGAIVEHAPLFVDGYTTVMLATILLYVVGTAMYWAFFRGHPVSTAPEAEAPATVPAGPAGSE